MTPSSPDLPIHHHIIDHSSLEPPPPRNKVNILLLLLLLVLLLLLLLLLLLPQPKAWEKEQGRRSLTSLKVLKPPFNPQLQIIETDGPILPRHTDIFGDGTQVGNPSLG